MSPIEIREAVEIASRFQLIAAQWLKRVDGDKYAVYGSKEGGALRRISMDLTRALTRMRKSQ